MTSPEQAQGDEAKTVSQQFIERVRSHSTPTGDSTGIVREGRWGVTPLVVPYTQYPVEIACFSERTVADEYGGVRTIYRISMETKERPYWAAIHEPGGEVPYRCDFLDVGAENPIPEEDIAMFLARLPQVEAVDVHTE